ncbi:MAG: M24 family metallopeptidase [Actinomycetota bacterium]|nr:M24 family metallopeptidase [Actinomycetota bacterium]
MEAVHERRLDRLLEVMQSPPVEWLWIEPSVDFLYLTGIETISMERLTGVLLSRSGDLRCVVPLLLEEEFESLSSRAEVVTWDDSEGPSAAVAHVLRDVDRLHVQGSLPMWAYLVLREAVSGLDVEVDPGSIPSLRERKDEAEANALRRSAQVTDQVMEWVAQQDLSGVTERRLAGRIQARYLELGHAPADWALVSSGENSSIPHHAGGDALVSNSAPLLTDFGARVDGYWSDTTRVHFPPGIEEDLRNAYEVVCAAYDAAFARVAEGVACSEVDGAARDVIERAGLGDRFIHRTGHGIGLDIHEPPYIKAGNEQKLEIGHVFTIEPGVYLPGRWGLRYENVVYLGPEGPEALNRTSRMHVLR